MNDLTCRPRITKINISEKTEKLACQNKGKFC